MAPKDIRALRKALGLTLQQMATKLGVSISTQERWELGVSKPSPRALADRHGLRDKAARIQRSQSA